jgi:prefoldin alpha subunit
METNLAMNNFSEIGELQTMQSELEKYSLELEEIKVKQEEIDISITAINEIVKLKRGSEILAGIADGIFIRTKLEDSTMAIINIGAGVIVEKPINDAIKLLEKHRRQVDNQNTVIESRMQKLSEEIIEKIAILEMKENMIEIKD